MPESMTAMVTPFPVAYLWSSGMLRAFETGDSSWVLMSFVSPELAQCAVCFMGTAGRGSPPSGTGVLLSDMFGGSIWAVASGVVVASVVASTPVMILFLRLMWVYFSRVWCCVVSKLFVLLGFVLLSECLFYGFRIKSGICNVVIIHAT